MIILKLRKSPLSCLLVVAVSTSHDVNKSDGVSSAADDSVRLDICFLNVSREFYVDDTRRHLSCEHAKGETVLKCVKHLELIFIPGKIINIQTLFV